MRMKTRQRHAARVLVLTHIRAGLLLGACFLCFVTGQTIPGAVTGQTTSGAAPINCAAEPSNLRCQPLVLTGPASAPATPAAAAAGPVGNTGAAAAATPAAAPKPAAAASQPPVTNTGVGSPAVNTGTVPGPAPAIQLPGGASPSTGPTPASPIPVLKPNAITPAPSSNATRLQPPPPRRRSPPPPPKRSPPPPPRRPPPPPARPPPPPPPSYLRPPISFQVQAETWVDSGSITIPKSFMGMSHEWPHIEEIYDMPDYKNLIQMLNSYGGGPHHMRVGGGSTDLQETVPGNEVWGPLAALFRETGTRYILGLNFEKGDVELARRQMQAALAGLPAESIISFEIGNEPNFYVNKSGRGGNDYVRCCLFQEWFEFGRQLSCPQGENSCVNNQFTGPVWGHVNVFPTTIDWFLRSGSVRWVEMTSVHWYKATSETENTAATLLDEEPIRREMANLRELVKVSNSYGKPLRVAEMNSISNSGRRNVSNVFAAALWTLDASLEVAQAGSIGVNLHQGAGQNLYTAIVRWYSNGTLALPIIRPPFYGMLMFQMAVRSSTKILDRQVIPINGTSAADAQLLKVWPLQDNESGELRWVIINKSDLRGGRVRVRINRNSGYATKATVARLVAPGNYPLTAMTGITLAGQSYGNGARIWGKETLETVNVILVKDMLQFGVYMPPGSAALVRLPRQ